MNNDWQKGIKDLQKISLTKSEQSEMLQKIWTRSPYHLIKSPWLFEQFVTFRKHAIIFSIFLIVATSAGITFASEKSLPGNLLYPVKINITEPARDLVKLVPAEKIEWQAQKATRRIEEAEILSVQNKLDDKKREKIETLFNKSTENFKEASEKEIERIDKRDEIKKQTEERKKGKEKARDEIENMLEKLEKAKDKAFKKKDKEKDRAERRRDQNKD